MRTISFKHPYWGVVEERFQTKRDAYEWALKREHGECDDTRCDITNMMEQGYPYAAASLLMSATDELPFLDAVIRKFGAVPRRVADKEHDEWWDLIKPYSRRCRACNAVVCGVKGEPPGSCNSCLAADLVEL
jgi:hypothetical protein